MRVDAAAPGTTADEIAEVVAAEGIPCHEEYRDDEVDQMISDQSKRYVKKAHSGSRIRR